jgi:hypothetical protein
MGEYAALFGAFWERVVEDLQKGKEDARLWLDTGDEIGGFLRWCEMTDKDPQWWRARLLRVWALPHTTRRK